MMPFLSARIVLASVFAGFVLMATQPGVARGSKSDAVPQGKDKKHVRFEAVVTSSDPFSAMNQPTPPPTGKFRRGELVQVVVKGTPLDGYHTYPLTQKATPKQGGQQTTLSFQAPPSLVPLYPIEESSPQWVDTKLGYYDLEHETPFTWTFEVLIKPDAPVNSTQELTLTVKYQACKTSCYVEQAQLKVAIPVGSEDPLTPSVALSQREKQPPLIERTVPATLSPLTKDVGTGDNLNGQGAAPSGLLQAILIAIGGGFVSLLTPCVFPMIPITVSYFLKQSESKHSSALLMALVYSGTIVLILTAGGLFLLSVLTKISTHFATNFALGAIFLFFGLSLLGWYDVALPSWLQDATAAREGKAGLLGVFFMALTFSIVSFSCVGPIYGGFISLKAGSASGQLQLVLSVVAFAVAFASPFFLLAMFPKLLKSMPRAGSWMNSVKVVMGFLELAAVVKFVRAGELSRTGAADYLSYDLSLGIYIALSVAAGLYLLGFYRLPHDHDTPESIGVPRLLFSLGFLTLALYLTPGLFKTASGQTMQPRGLVFAWVDSFLLPDPETDKAWNSKMATALDQAKKENKRIFLDFTGTLCTNCKLNESNAFRRPEIKTAMQNYVLLKLYTDKATAGVEQVPSESESMQLQINRFKTSALPLYAILEPTGDDYRIVRIYNGGLIQTAAQREEFLDFLAQ